jgi:hypothetical protein
MKICSKCKKEKQCSDFYKNKARYDGFCNYCKECDKKKPVNKEKARARYKKWCESEYSRNYHKKYYQENKEIYVERNRRWYGENTERYRELWRKTTKRKTWRLKHKAQQAKRRAKKLNATLPGYDAEIKEIYKNCPDGYHVDHMIPLVNKNVCGLHVPWNLQYLPAEENLRKSNKIEEKYVQAV